MAKKQRQFPKGVFIWFEEEGMANEWLAVGTTLDEASRGLSAGEEREVAEYYFGYLGKTVVNADYVPG